MKGSKSIQLFFSFVKNFFYFFEKISILSKRTVNFFNSKEDFGKGREMLKQVQHDFH